MMLAYSSVYRTTFKCNIGECNWNADFSVILTILKYLLTSREKVEALCNLHVRRVMHLPSIQLEHTVEC